MNSPISNPTDCEVRGVIRFLQAENVRPSEIHRRLVAVYGEHVKNAASVRKWCTIFRNGRTDVHDAERSGRPSVITDALKQKANQIIRENRHFTISEVYEQCPEVSRTVSIFSSVIQLCTLSINSTYNTRDTSRVYVLALCHVGLRHWYCVPDMHNANSTPWEMT